MQPECIESDGFGSMETSCSVRFVNVDVVLRADLKNLCFQVAPSVSEVFYLRYQIVLPVNCDDMWECCLQLQSPYVCKTLTQRASIRLIHPIYRETVGKHGSCNIADLVNPKFQAHGRSLVGHRPKKAVV
jgi:hypothetical protein